jgi:hypothetical protein
LQRVTAIGGAASRARCRDSPSSTTMRSARSAPETNGASRSSFRTGRASDRVRRPSAAARCRPCRASAEREHDERAAREWLRRIIVVGRLERVAQAAEREATS